eukprot:TRINITY_DN199_c3_g1_i1.p1 TRINITY_DN199_c3_g1~~TRINITY_DN199_c3_g1_i1.p1  ORF type:complete len:93 (+),score=17.37 TRINITY_DN199_c3_g1_i1:64-342(+)
MGVTKVRVSVFKKDGKKTTEDFFDIALESTIEELYNEKIKQKMNNTDISKIKFLDDGSEVPKECKIDELSITEEQDEQMVYITLLPMVQAGN